MTYSSLEEKVAKNSRKIRWLQLMEEMENESYQYELEALTMDYEPEIQKYRIREKE